MINYRQKYSVRYLASLLLLIFISVHICCHLRTKIQQNNLFRKVRYYGTEKIPYRAITYNILVRTEISVQYFFGSTGYRKPFRFVPSFYVTVGLFVRANACDCAHVAWPGINADMQKKWYSQLPCLALGKKMGIIIE